MSTTTHNTAQLYDKAKVRGAYHLKYKPCQQSHNTAQLYDKAKVRGAQAAYHLKQEP